VSKFQGNDFSIREEETFSNAPRVVKTSQPVERQVQDFKMTRLSAEQGSGASSGSPRPGTQEYRDHRFVMSQLAKEALAVGKEDEKVIEQQVAERLKKLSEETYQKAFSEGHAKGFEQGKNEALESVMAETRERFERMDALIQSMESAKSELLDANREFLMNVVYRIAKAVVLKEISADKDYLLRLARELIEKCGLRDQLTLKIHPDDAEALEKLKEGLIQSFSSLKNLSIELSDHVASGGCVLETEWGAIDASLETQLSQIVKSLDVPKGTTP
jgi:flagellar assembly protein FliH